MMRIPFIHIIKVIFVLSTVVVVTDCCSSRILLLREHTLKIVQHQHNFHNHMHEHAHELQQQIEEHVVQLVNQMELQQQQQEEQQQQQQLQATVREVPPDPREDEDGELLPNTVEEASVEPMLEEQLLGEQPTAEPPASSTDSSLAGESTTKTDGTTETTTLSTVTHTGEPPPDDSSPSTRATLSTTIPPDKVKDTAEIIMLPCRDSFKTSFCLNGGNCFRYPLGNQSLYSCLCADGYDGQRCEFKNWNGDYVKAPPALEAHPKIRMARIVFSFPMLILLSTIYVLFAAVFMLRNAPEYRRKQQQLHLHKQRFFVRC
ncbi:protein gurken [Drosophila persimilis]|uniref:protein gurken n=1 Tax=Drosophila persimilis TaxID=7234 RepID=UPI000F074A4E|nr:protein gurken [Drosophila persimilis]